jgi:hypothetical protein
MNAGIGGAVAVLHGGKVFGHSFILRVGGNREGFARSDSF